MHVMSQHSEKLATLACPLCQDMFPEWDRIENHVIDNHNVKKESVNKLMALVDSTEWLAAHASATAFEQKHEVTVENEEVHPVTKAVFINSSTLPVNTCTRMGVSTSDHNDLENDDPAEVKQKMPDIDSRSDSSSDQSKDEGDFACDMCGRIFAQVEDLFYHQNEMGHLQFKVTSQGNSYYCWGKGCELSFETMTATQLHFKECHALKSNILISKSPVYKYRCTECWHSFKTFDMLTIHMQHHVIRSATKCFLCGRSFGTIHALQKHIEMAHCGMTKEEIEQYRASLMNNPLSAGGTIESSLDGMPGQLLIKETPEEMDKDLPDKTVSLPGNSEDITEDVNEGIRNNKELQVLEDCIKTQAMAENRYNDPNRKYKCHLCKVSFTRQSFLMRHNKTLLHKREKMNYQRDEYLDSNGPFKREVRKESLTQKNILLDHYNSVFHLHKLKHSMDETNFVGTPLNHKACAPAPLDPTISSTSERPDAAPPSEFHQRKLSENQITSISEALCNSTSTTTAARASKTEESFRPFPVSTTTAQTSSSVKTVPPRNSSQFTFPLHTDHNNIMQQTPGFLPTTSLQQNHAPPYYCKRCRMMCSSANALIQHHQLYCIFAQPQYAPSPMLNLQANNYQNSIIPSLSRWQVQKQKVDKDEAPEKQSRTSLGQPKTSDSPVLQINHLNSQRSSTPGQQMSISRFPLLKPKPLILRHLLEDFGFDVVMQFNENSQRRHKKQLDKEDDQAENCSQKSKQVYKKNQKKIDLPEINRPVCEKCGKVFSNIWVLKAHQEETHKDIVPIKAIEKFTEEFQEVYKWRNTTVVDDAANMAEAPSPSSNGELSTGASSTPATPCEATPLPVSNVATPSVTSLGSQMPDVESLETANYLAPQVQFNQHLMGLGMGLPMHMGINMNLPLAASMNIHLPLIPLMKLPSLDPHMASAFGHPIMPGTAIDPNFFAAQQKLLQKQQLRQQKTCIRTRINDDQLKILRAYLDINKTPMDEQFLEISEKSGVPLKVVKSWFRNNLFRERQRNKDSHYNFDNPPTTYLNLEEYKKTGEAKITQLTETKPNIPKNNTESLEVVKKESIVNLNESEKIVDMSEACVPETKKEKFSISDYHQKTGEPLQSKRSELTSTIQSSSNVTSSAASDHFSMSKALPSAAASCTPTSSSLMPLDLRTSLSESFLSNLKTFVFKSSMMPLMPPTSAFPPTTESQHSTVTPSITSTPSCFTGKRDKIKKRTTFTDYEINVLKEFFETDAYPVDNVLKYLSKLLSLNRKVITGWFQNARLKAHKVYEDENAGRIQRTPGRNYQCKYCLRVFQRYYERIKHQKRLCFKKEIALVGQVKVMSGDERSSPTPTLPTPTQPTTPVVPRDNPEQHMVVSSKNNNQNGAYRCDKCSLSFVRFDLWREHQVMHMMNPTILSNLPPRLRPPSP